MRNDRASARCGGRIAAASPIHDGHGTRILISLPKSIATHPDLL